MHANIVAVNRTDLDWLVVHGAGAVMKISTARDGGDARVRRTQRGIAIDATSVHWTTAFGITKIAKP